MSTLTETVDLYSPPVITPPTFRELLKSSHGSAAGYHAVSNWLECPERSRLNSLGVSRRIYDEFRNEELSAISFGTLCHFLRALRVTQGHDAVEHALEAWRNEIPNKSWLLAKMLFRTYESLHPRAADSMEYLGVECEVVTNINRGEFATSNPAPIYRTVRYDTVVRLPAPMGGQPELFTFEAKTSARGGQYSMQPYTTQAMVQVALWNGNPNLVAKYGRMSGVIFDVLLKTTTPNVDRIGPLYFGKPHNRMALEYLALPESGAVTFNKLTDGKYPKMLHACWGRFNACQYIGVCHERAYGDFEFRDGEVYDGR